MLTYNLEKKTESPLYMELYKSVKKDIERGNIKANGKLPSKRELAEHLGISIMTVQNAYAQLVAEGFIYSKQRKGYFACEISHILQTGVSYIELSNPLLEMPSKDMDTINLCENSISSKQFPFTVWAKQMRQVISENDDILLSKLPNMGLWSLRKAISDYLYRFRGMVVDPNLIVIGAGTEYLYGLIIKLLGRDKNYAIEDPGYKKISQIYNAEGVQIKYIPIDKSGLRVDSLMKENADVVHLSPSHHFPIGTVMPIKRRMEILKWVHSTQGRYIIEDDYDSEFRFEGKPLPTLMSNDTMQKTIYINTFSKTIAPSLRISYMILTPELAKKYNEQLGFYTCPVSGFEQYILAKFITDGHFERHINRMRRFYKKSRDSIIHLIKNSPLGSISEIKEEMSGLHFVLKLKTNKSDYELKTLAKTKGLKISFISDYSFDPKNCPSSEMIVNYSGIEIDTMKKALDILSSILIELKT